jgi:glycosyltransferase involved in cell wall biosynthesis
MGKTSNGSGPVRVCFMIDRLSRAGTESQLVALIRNLDRSCVEPFLCLLDGDHEESRHLEPDCCPVLRLSVRCLKHPSTVGEAVRLARFLKERRIEVLHVYFDDSTLFGVPVARLAGVPHVVQTRNSLSYWMTPTLLRTSRIINRLVSATVANCEACRQAVLADVAPPRKSVLVLENGVDLERFAKVPPVESRRGQQRWVGMVANLRPVKDPETFLRAAAQVAGTHPEVHFSIAGEGQLRPALEQLARELRVEERFHLPGPVADVPHFLAALDLAVLCSTSEGMSNAILEYMAAGRPIVATAVGANSQLIENRGTGLLVPPGDPAQLARAISELLDDPDRAALLGAAARRRCQEHYSRQRSVRRFEDFFLKLADKQRSASILPAANGNGFHTSPNHSKCQASVDRTPGCRGCTVKLLSAPAAWQTPDIRAKWQELSQTSEQVYAQYSSPEWFDHLQAAGFTGQLRLAIAHGADGQVIGMAPLRASGYTYNAMLKGFPVWKLRLKAAHLLGSQPLLPPSMEVHDEFFLALGKGLEQTTGIYLHSVPTSSFLWEYLHSSRVLRDHFYLTTPGGLRPLHLIDLPTTYADYLGQFTAKKRSDLRRKVRLLGERGGGEIQLQRVTAAEQVFDFLDAVALVHDQAWQAPAADLPLDNSPRNRSRLADLAQRGLLRAYWLRCGGRPCAFVLGYQFRNIYHYADPRYHQDFKALSPGTVLLWLMLEDLFQHDPPRWLNFGIGEARYKMEFGNRQYEDASVLLLRKNAVNRVRQAGHWTFESMIGFLKKHAPVRRDGAAASKTLAENDR